MNCNSGDSRPDWNAYALGELSQAEARSADQHAASCEACRAELASLRMTLQSLTALKQEEPPRRVAFVSDKVFEPRWYQRIASMLLSPTFAGAALLAAAIVAHGVMQPSGVSEADVQARIDKAVGAVTAQLEAQQQDLRTAVRTQSGYMTQIYKEQNQLVKY